MTIRFTRDAEADVIEILRETRDELGLSQTAACKDIMQRVFDMIEGDPMRAGGRALDEFGSQVRQLHLAAPRAAGAARRIS